MTKSNQFKSDLNEWIAEQTAQGRVVSMGDRVSYDQRVAEVIVDGVKKIISDFS